MNTSVIRKNVNNQVLHEIKTGKTISYIHNDKVLTII